MSGIKAAVIGIGNIGSAHAASIAQNEINGMSLAAVCDIDEKKLADFCGKYNIKGYTSYEKLFADGLCDSVIIAVPHPLHTEIAQKAFECGLNVMLEKPADISVSRVKRLINASKSSGRVFSVMFNQRTDRLFAKAREIVKSGELGELKRTVWIITNWFRTQSYYNSGGWRATWSGEGGGVLINQCPHQLDLWQWICGMPESVRAFCGVAKYHEIEVEDEATVFTKYKNGATGVFITSTGEYPGTNRLEISGGLGKIVLENGTLKHYRLKTPTNSVIAESRDGFARIEYEYEEIKAESTPRPHTVILQNFANAVLYGEKLISPGEQAINELTLSNAAYLSDWQGGAEIKLPFDEEAFDRILAQKAADSAKQSRVAEDTSKNAAYLPRWQVSW